MKIQRWTTIETEIVYRTPILDLHRRRSTHEHRGARDFFVLDAPDWVNIIPLTSKREVVMIRQWRHGIADFTLEIPGGMVDADDPSPKHAARREMREETGYDSGRIAALGRVHPNPAIQPNVCHSFLARDVRLTSTPKFDSAEETEVELVPLSRIKPLIVSGRIMHALTIAAFSFFQIYKYPRLR
jgi:ADP-ribose pyrophosphatase